MRIECSLNQYILASVNTIDVDMAHKRIITASVATQLLMIMQLVTRGFTCGPGIIIIYYYYIRSYESTCLIRCTACINLVAGYLASLCLVGSFLSESSDMYFVLFGKDICDGETQSICFYKELTIRCYSSDVNACRCMYYDNGEIIHCNTFSNTIMATCWHYPTTTITTLSCADNIAFGHDTSCTGNGYIHTNCDECTSTSTSTVRCFCNMYNCEFCNISSSTMETSSSFMPTGITNTSLTSSSYGSSSATSFIGLTAISHTGLSLITDSLTIFTSKPTLVLTTPSTVTQAKPLTSPSIVAQAKPSPILTSPCSTVAQANTAQVIAGVMPTVCILTLGAFSLLVVVFVILYRKNKNKQNLMSVNQRGSTGYKYGTYTCIIDINLHSLCIQYSAADGQHILFPHAYSA